MRAENRMHDPVPTPLGRQHSPTPPPRQDDEVDLAELLGALIDGRWLIGAAAFFALVVGGLYAFTAAPVYRADVLVQVEDKGSGSDPFKDLSAMFSGETPAEAEIEIIRSRSVVQSVIAELGLDVVVEPRRIPLFGGFLARRHAGEAPAPAKLWMDSFAWGGERLEFTSFRVHPAYEDHPFVFIAGEGGTFELQDADGGKVLDGRVGEEVSGDGVTLHVQALSARPGTEFTVTKIPLIDAVNRFQQSLSVREKGKKTGVIQIEVQGTDKAVIREALDALTAAWVRQNVSRKTEEAEKTLEFVSSQLPLLKSNLDEAELRLKEHQSKTGKVDLGIEAQALVDRAAELEKQITTLELQRSELLQRFTREHPNVVALRRKMQSLQTEKRTLETQARSLPETELASVRLSRDVKVANELYVLLLTKAQEIGVVKSGTIGNVRVIDPAVTAPRPVRPRKGMTLLMSLMVGLGLGVALTLVRRTLNRGVDDPEQVERELGVSVFASVPHSPKQEEMVKLAPRKSDALRPLAAVEPADLAVESLRSLRTSLQFSLATAKRKVVMIGGSRPGVGKSFISVNLAHVLADAGKRVLLIDADIRKGQLHRYFGSAGREGGLSEAISGAELSSVVRKTQNANLDFIATGAIPSNPSELLASDRFAQLVAECEGLYDLLVIDAPPILAVTDAALIARVTGVNLLVVKSGLHPMREIGQAVARMEQSGARPNGFVFNAVPLRGRLYGYGKYRYHYQYDYR